jgi:hypothetical protein
MAVDDMASAQPTASAACHARPAAIAAPPVTSTVATTCRLPTPSTALRMRQKAAGSSSRPTRNSIITTPNSAKCMMSPPSCPMKPSR